MPESHSKIMNKEVKKLKKVISILLALGIGLLLVSGCQTTSSNPTTTSNIPADDAAGYVGDCVAHSLSADNGMTGVVTSFSACGTGIRAATVSTPEYGADGWWSASDNYSYSGMTNEVDYNFKVWNTGGTEQTTLAGLAALTSTTIGQLSMYTVWSFLYAGATTEINYGASKTDPLIFSGINTTSPTVSGPISYSSSYLQYAFTITLDYVSLDLVAATGVPASGSVNFSIVENGATTWSGTVTFNGTTTAVLTITGAGTYNVNLNTGLATPASI